MFERVHVIGTGRAGSAIRGRLLERGLAVTDGRMADPGAELVLLCVPDQVIGEVAAGVASVHGSPTSAAQRRWPRWRRTSCGSAPTRCRR